MGNRASGTIMFHDAVTTTGNGAVFKVHDATILNIVFDISTGGTFEAAFEGQVQYQGDWFPIQAVNLSNMTISDVTTDATGIYQIDTTGFEGIRVKLTSLNGTLSCFGKGVF